MQIREAKREDLQQLLELYTQLHNNSMPSSNKSIKEIWNEILTDKNHHIMAGFIEDKLVSSCVVVVVPNLTHNQRPYALVENVITHEAHRNKGYATAILSCAKKIAMSENCYKIMLLTSSKEESTLDFYEKAGYNRNDKTGFVQWMLNKGDAL